MKPRIVALLALVFGTAPAVGHATTVRALSLRELTQKSDLIIVGRPVSQESFWQFTHIQTLVRVAVDEVWMGPSDAPREVDVLTYGGTVGDLGQQVDGAARLYVGRTMVLHLRNASHQTGEYTTVGMAQGAWLVDASNAPDGVTDASAVTRPGIDRVVNGRNVPEATPQNLGELRKAIAEAAHGP